MLSLAVLGCHTIVIHYSRMSSDSIIAASAVEKNQLFLYCDVIANAINRSALSAQCVSFITHRAEMLAIMKNITLKNVNNNKDSV